MKAQASHDEFEERIRLVTEAQQIADDYSERLLRTAINAFLIAGLSAFLVWFVWKIATRSDLEFMAQDPVVQELREHVGR
jgi:hypothetical protein